MPTIQQLVAQITLSRSRLRLTLSRLLPLPQQISFDTAVSPPLVRNRCLTLCCLILLSHLVVFDTTLCDLIQLSHLASFDTAVSPCPVSCSCPVCRQYIGYRAWPAVAWSRASAGRPACPPACPVPTETAAASEPRTGTAPACRRR